MGSAKANRKYDEANTVQIKLKLNLKTDADILAHLDAKENKQGYIKSLIRHDLEIERIEKLFKNF